MNKQVKINKYPCLLWLHYSKEVEVDFENQKVKSDGAAY